MAHQHPIKQTNQLRIIGGQWRSRKLSFPSIDGLRPTPDRVRETLFNWLAASIAGARCLDLFAGSGALGLEALSRGASYVDIVDNSSPVVQSLRHNLQLLGGDAQQVSHSSADNWLQQSPQPYDVIFLDPPFHQGLLADCIERIDQQQLLAARGWVYLETPRSEAPPTTPAHWQLHREKTAGQVSYRLYTRVAS